MVYPLAWGIIEKRFPKFHSLTFGLQFILANRDSVSYNGVFSYAQFLM